MNCHKTTVRTPGVYFPLPLFVSLVSVCLDSAETPGDGVDARGGTVASEDPKPPTEGE